MCWKRLFGYAIILTAFLGAYSLSLFAATIEELKKEIEARSEEIKKLEEEEKEFLGALAEKEEETQTLKSQVAQIDRALRKIQTDIRKNQVELSRTELQIEKLQLEIKEKEAAIERQQKTSGILLRQLAESERESLVEILLKNRFLSEFFNRLDFMISLQKSIQQYAQELRLLKRELQGKGESLAVKRKDLKRLDAMLADRRVIQQQQRQERATLLQVTRNQEKRYQELLAQNEAKQEVIAREIEELEEQLRTLVDPASLPPQKEGFFVWPAQGRLTQRFGRTAFARQSHFYQFHNGIDIANFVGTPIVAAGNGRVVATGDADQFCRGGAYGKYIVIDHGNNLITLYAHLSLTRVTPGQEIDRGELIGYMGHTGRSVGSHLHFTVYDARTFQIKQSKVCGPLPYGGAVDPLKYL